MSESKKSPSGLNLKALLCFMVICVCAFGIPAKTKWQSAYAAQNQKKDNEKTDDEKMKDAVISRSSNNYTLEFQKAKPKRIRQHIYESPNIKTFSYLHWSASILDIKDDENIDFFLKITECELYKRFRADEFEWARIRDATRDYIEENKLDFPVRYEIVIPLKMGEYNKEKSYFELNTENAVKSVRLVEMMATDIFFRDICGDESRDIGNYYRGFILELSRPFSLQVVPAENDTAQRIITEKNKQYQDYLKTIHNPHFSQSELFKLREAYAFVYVKIFTYKGQYPERTNEGYYLGQLLGVVDGYEIFEDITRKKLLYSRSYITKRDHEKESENLKKEIEVLKLRIKDKGILYSSSIMGPFLPGTPEAQAAEQAQPQQN